MCWWLKETVSEKEGELGHFMAMFLIWLVLVSAFGISIAFNPEDVEFCHQVKEFHSQRYLVFLSTISPRYTKFEQT